MCTLAEVFSVTYKRGGGDGAAPIGTISVFDGKRGQIIYRCDQTEAPPSGSATQNEEYVPVVLTGPYRAISAEGCVAIVLDLHHAGCKDKDKKPIEILLDVYDPSTIYDVAVKKNERMCSCDNALFAEVTCALLSDAVEAIVVANLLSADSDCYVHRILARHLGKIVVLFQSDVKNAPSIGIIPLNRSVLAVPLASSLEINIELRGNSDDKTVKAPLTNICQPNLESGHVLDFHTQNGLKVQVKLTYSD